MHAVNRILYPATPRGQGAVVINGMGDPGCPGDSATAACPLPACVRRAP
ncbi:MAG TPA: hypothetical protein DEF41_01835 [Desulfovibrio sp.]|nr:hypothetical protein [Desulfovibrio sp.]